MNNDNGDAVDDNEDGDDKDGNEEEMRLPRTTWTCPNIVTQWY